MIDIFIVDDGSEKSTAEELLYNYVLPEWGPTLQLWRVSRNLGFNSHGCRNLIAKYAETDSIAFFDIDMIMYPTDMAKLKTINFSDHGKRIFFHDLYIKTNQKYVNMPGHENCFVITKDLFWEAGGYDESFTGHHWGDREFVKRIIDTGAKKRHTSCKVELTRKGRHGTVRPDLVDKTVYIDDDKFIVPLSTKKVKKLKGTITRKLNFPFVRIL